MSILLTDHQIEELILEVKLLPPDFRSKLYLRPKRSHKEGELDILGENGNEFRVILRQNMINNWDFSVIVGFRPEKSNQIFRLRRYNGKHAHTNKIEKTTFYNFHIHFATERYQQSGFKEDTYAEMTNRYSELSGAFDCLLFDCSFKLPDNTQSELF